MARWGQADLGQDFAEAGFIVESRHRRVDSQLSKVRVRVSGRNSANRPALVPYSRAAADVCARLYARSCPWRNRFCCSFRIASNIARDSAAAKPFSPAATIARRWSSCSSTADFLDSARYCGQFLASVYDRPISMRGKQIGLAGLQLLQQATA